MKNILLDKKTPLTKSEKELFAYFGEGAKIRPPFRILNPQNIHVGDFTTLRENCYVHAYKDNTNLMNYIDNQYIKGFKKEDYKYNSFIHLDREIQIGRGALISCTNRITIERNVVFSENTFLGDNNHSFTHPEVPIVQQPNKKGNPILIGRGSWIGFGAAILGGTKLGRNSVVGANSVVSGEFLSHSVVGTEHAKLLFRRYNK